MSEGMSKRMMVGELATKVQMAFECNEDAAVLIETDRLKAELTEAILSQPRAESKPTRAVNKQYHEQVVERLQAKLNAAEAERDRLREQVRKLDAIATSLLCTFSDGRSCHPGHAAREAMVSEEWIDSYRKDLALLRAETPEPAPKPERSTCEWEDLDGEMWRASCGLVWVMENLDGPKANEMHYCPKCGKTIKEKPAASDGKGE